MSEIIRTSQLPNWEGGAPGPHELSTLDGLRAYQDPAHEEFLEAADTILSKWQGDQFVGLYLYGNPGTGKTHAAIGLGRALHDSGAEVHYRFGPSNTYRTVESQLDNLTANRLHESTRGVTFPQNFKSGAPRNPRSVLIFDEYQPQNQAALKGSITAAAQYGGLIVITSNYKDPFKPLEVQLPEQTPTDLLATKLLTEMDPKVAERMTESRTQTAVDISESLRSRFANEVKLIEMSGPDRRAERSFWA